MTTVPSAEIAAASAPARAVARRNQRLLLVLVVIAVGMGGFGFALSKMYTLICQATGTQMSPNNAAVAAAAPAPTGRVVEVFFEKKVFDHMPVRFFPDADYQKAEVGVDQRNVYHFQNLSTKTLHFRPIHQVNPPIAAKSFGMKVCFCFNDQVIGPGETKDFEVVYQFSPDLHENVTMVQLLYSLHEIDDSAAAERGGDRGAIEEKVGGEGAIVTPGYRADDASGTK